VGRAPGLSRHPSLVAAGGGARGRLAGTRLNPRRAPGIPTATFTPERFMPSHSRILGVAAGTLVLATALAATAAACPPQIAVERPHDPSPDSTFLLVHASPGCQRGTLTVTGTAEGLVAGERRSIPLELTVAGTEGVYRVRRQWPSRGVWVLRLVARVGAGSATALVGVNAAGEIAAVRQQDPARRVHPSITDADVDRMLRSLAAG
jgi:hypothetical protein